MKNNKKKKEPGGKRAIPTDALVSGSQTVAIVVTGLQLL